MTYDTLIEALVLVITRQQNKMADLQTKADEADRLYDQVDRLNKMWGDYDQVTLQNERMRHKLWRLGYGADGRKLTKAQQKRKLNEIRRMERAI